LDNGRGRAYTAGFESSKLFLKFGDFTLKRANFASKRVSSLIVETA
jgi:hypothetical protein